MNALLRRLTRVGMRRGLTGEHWAWLLLAGAAFLLRRSREVEEPATTIELAPGERYLVRLVDAGERGRRRRGDRRRLDGAGPLGDLVAAALEGDGRDGGRATAGPAASGGPAGAPSSAD